MIITKVGFDMNNSNSALSIAILATLFEKKKFDPTELLVPFVTYVLGKNFIVGDKITEDFVCDKLKEFGFTDDYGILSGVINQVLERICKKKKGVYKKNREFYLNSNYAEEINRFELNQLNAEVERSALAKRVKSFIEKNRWGEIAEEKAIEYLLLFLDEYGAHAYENTEQLERFDYSQNKYNYIIAQFIIELSKEKEQKDFHRVLHLYKGILISRLIYIQPNNNDLQDSHFEKLSIYLDTPILFAILKLKPDLETNRARNLLKLLESEIKLGKIKLKCFKHTFEELKRNIELTKTNPEAYARQVLFVKNKFNNEDIDVFISSLEKNLKINNIDIEERPFYDPNNAEYKDIFEDENGLREKIRQDTPHYRTNALENDVYSYIAINMLRKGEKYDRIENCKALLLTTNEALLRSANYYLRKETGKMNLGISYSEFATILWLKDYGKNNEVPAQMLVDSALCISDILSDELMKYAFNRSKRYSEFETDISAIKQYQFFSNNILDPLLEVDNLSQDAIEKFDAKISKLITQEVEKQTSSSTQQVNEIKHQNIQLSNTLLEKEDKTKKLEEDNKKSKEKISKLYENDKKKAKNKSKIFAITVTIILYIIVVGLIVGIPLIGFDSILNPASIISSVFTILYTILDFSVSKFNFLIKFKNILQNNIYKYYHKKIIKKYE